MLPDRWNPRLRLRDWLCRPTAAERAAMERSAEEFRAFSESLRAGPISYQDLGTPSSIPPTYAFDLPEPQGLAGTEGASPQEGHEADRISDPASPYAPVPAYTHEVQAYAERVEKAATEACPPAPFRSLCARSRALCGLLRRALSRIAHGRAGWKSPERPGSEPRE